MLRLLTVLFAAACATGPNVSGTAAYVAIGNVWNEREALPHAEAHCAQHGRTPRLRSFENYRAIFDCVADG